MSDAGIALNEVSAQLHVEGVLRDYSWPRPNRNPHWRLHDETLQVYGVGGDRVDPSVSAGIDHRTTAELHGGVSGHPFVY